jgi:hypothetical protein
MLSRGLAALKESGDRATADRRPAPAGLLCERRAARLETVRRVVEGCGASLYNAESFAAFEEGKARAGGIVLVAVDEETEAGEPRAGQVG